MFERLKRCLYKAAGPALLYGASALSPAAAHAENFESVRHETAEHRIRGGAGLALDDRLSASQAFRDPGFGVSVLSVDVEGHFSDIDRIKDVFDVEDLSDMIDEGISSEDDVDDVLGLVGADISLDARMFAELARVNYNWRGRSVFFGGYVEAEAFVTFGRPDSLNKDSFILGGRGVDDWRDLVEFYVSLEQDALSRDNIAELRGFLDLSDTRVELGRDFNFFSVFARMDTGAFVGYARAFETRNASVSFGVQARYFHRWMLREYSLDIAGVVDSRDDVQFTRQDVVEGDGLVFDISMLLKLDDPYFGSVFAASIENLGMVWYEDSKGIDVPRLSLGAAFRPLRQIGHDAWIIAVDVENIGNGLATFQLGTSYEIPIPAGVRVRLVPGVGFEFNGRDIFRNYGRDMVTAGLGLEIGKCGIAGAFEYDIDNDVYRISAGIDFGF